MLRIVVIALVFFGALFVLTTQIPERVFARSADGMVEVEGVSRLIRAAVVERLSEDDHTLFPASPSNARTSRYLVDVDTGGTDFTPTVIIQLTKEEINGSWEKLPVIRRWNEATQMWEALETQVDFTTQTVRASVSLASPAVLVVTTP